MRNAARVEIVEDGGRFVGFLLEADYCSEHERGIRPLSQALGIKPLTPAPGLPRRSMPSPCGYAVTLLADGRAQVVRPGEGEGAASRRRVAEDVRLLLVDGGLRYSGPEYMSARARTVIKEHGFNAGDAEAVGSWDDSAFAIVAFSARAKAFVTELSAAIEAGDAAFWPGSADVNPFGRKGLVAAIASRVPAETAARMAERDTQAETLAALSAATGIERRLREAGRQFFALTPRLASQSEAPTTSHPVVYWLNPCEQAINEAGWYTVEELDEWIAGTGPVLAKPKRAPGP